MASEIEPPPKSVQELSVDGGEPSEKFFHRGTDAGNLDAAVPLIEIPVIDIGNLTSMSPSTKKDEFNKLHFALSSYGCFQVINHGMTSLFLDKMREVARVFFALPVEEKKKYLREADSIEGYGNDMILSNNQTLDWTDRLYLTLSPPHHLNLRFWPQNPQTFRETLDEYFMKTQKINEILLKAMAISLDLEEDRFLKQCRDGALVTVRFNYYPPCPRPNQILGVKPHADASALTILLQDKHVEGLQFLKDSQWFKVPIIPEALLVNVGDQVEIMSNGVFKSPVHRVVTNSERERITMAMFFVPGSDREIEPDESLINETRPRLYKKVKDYASIFFQYYQLGKRPIEAAMV